MGGPLQVPTAFWQSGDRLAFSPTGAAPWSILDAASARVLESNATASPPGPAPVPILNRGLGPYDNARRWEANAASGDLVVTDNRGGTSLRVPGAQNYNWAVYGDMSWNADGNLFFAMRIDEREVHRIPIVDYSTGIERVTYASYPKNGTPLPVNELYVVDPAKGEARPAKLDTRDAYVWYLGWRPTVSEALVMLMSRDGKRLELFAIAPDGSTRLLAHDERPNSFVAALDFSTENWLWQMIPLGDKDGFLWMSERDGWRHVYHYGYDGKLKTQVTKGAFPVHRIVRIDSAQRQIYVIASADTANPYDRHLYRVALDGTGFTALTAGHGEHNPSFSSSGKYFIDSYSHLTQPRTTELRSSDGRLIKTLGQASSSQLAAIGYRPPEPFKVKAADGVTDLYGVLYKPADFDASKKYPIIDYIYAGPFVNVHQTSYGPAQGMHRISAALAQMGFIVAMLDARGTPGRGKAFQDANYGHIGEIEIPDHIAAIKEAARTRPWMDTTRAGIVGHSWGGYFAIHGMLQGADFFKAGYAGAPGSLMEAASINEPNMGLYENNKAAYDAQMNFNLASRLRGHLKMMHGTSDNMAPFSTTMRMAQALIAANKTFDLLIMPGQGHGPAGDQARYYREDIRRYMTTYLIGPDGPALRED
jgi:dipeptidyl aminopeptidase/acylaminoacyl peptidase